MCVCVCVCVGGGGGGLVCEWVYIIIMQYVRVCRSSSVCVKCVRECKYVRATHTSAFAATN